MKKWLHGLRYRTCSTCGQEFRRHPALLPSLVGFSYCSTPCEAAAWSKWVEGR